MVVLLATCLSRLGLRCLGRRFQLLQHRRAGVELADRRRPRQVLDHFNLYCICFPPNVTSQRRDERGRGVVVVEGRKSMAWRHSGEREMSGSREQKKKTEEKERERERVSETLPERTAAE